MARDESRPRKPHESGDRHVPLPAGIAASAVRRARFERNGGPYGRLELTQLSPDEAHTLNGLLTPQRPFAPGGEARIKLPRLDAQLRGSRFAISLEDALVATDGPLGDRRAELAAAAAARDAAWARVLRHSQSSRPELAPWLEHARCRYAGASPERTAMVLDALDVLSVLPADGQPLAALAASYAGGDAHALDRNRPLGRLVAAALFALEEAAPRERVSADEWRAVWARVGISCDELSSTVLTLGLRPHRLARGYLAARLRAAARAGKPLVLTLAELRAEPPQLAGEVLFTCENPSIVAGAAAELGARCPVCRCRSATRGNNASLGIPPGGVAIDWNEVVFEGLALRGIYGTKMYETWFR